MKNKLTILAAAVLVAASISASKAQPYAIAGDFNGWNNSSTLLSGGPTVYTYAITGGTPGNFEGLKIIAVPGNWSTTYPGNNLEIQYDASGDNTVYFYPGSFADGWLPSQNRVGFADPGNMTFEITGDFTNPNWGDDPNGLMTLVPASNGVYQKTWVFATPGSHNFKIRTPGTWNDFNCGTDFGGGGNVVVTTTSANQSVTILLDLPNGRLNVSVPITYCYVQFSVDMTLVAENDPGFDSTSVTVNGDALPNSWNGTPLTNNPAAANPNVYTSTNLSIAVGTAVQYQFRYNSYGSPMYDALGGVSGQNRTVVVPNLAYTNIPPVYWDDASPNDVLDADTVATFSVNMNGAVGNDAVTFDPNADIVCISSDFLGWPSWNPDDLPTLTENPFVSGIYTYSYDFPKGHVRSVTYKFGINGVDDEAGFAQNHFRYIRSHGGAAYNFPVDTFGTQYGEPKVGGLVIGTPSGESIPISWLPYPNVKLQTSSDLFNWTDVDGAQYPLPSSTLPCSISVTMGDSPQFFRLVQPTP
jgi:hypothetical protein